MPLILGAQSAVATGYNIDNSCRFNSGDSAKLNITQGTPTDDLKWTISFWFKKVNDITPATQYFMGAGSGSDTFFIRTENTADNLDIEGLASSGTGGRIVTTQKFRDPSSWYHFMYAYDSANGTAGDRMKMFINGTEVTAFATDTNPTLNQPGVANTDSVVLYIGSAAAGAEALDAYMADIILIDGQALTPSSFGEFNEDSPTIWQPIDPSALTFGDNGFWLDFADSAALGNDVSGNNNDFTPANLAAADQCQDSPTNNFCTMNPLDNYWRASVFTYGNNTLTGSTSNNNFNTGTLAMTAGKWYWEALIVDANDANQFWGIVASTPTSANDHLVDTTNSKYIYDGSNGNVYPPASGGSGVSYGDTYTTGDYVAIYLDFDNSKIYFSKNGVIQNSGTGVTFTPSLSTSDGGLGQWTPVLGNGAITNFGACSWNFGNGSFGSTSAGATNADANGYGVFKYSPNDGGSASFDGSAKDFLALCTKNMGSDGG